MTKRLCLLALLLPLAACETPAWLGGKGPEIKRLPGERMAALPVPSHLQADEAVKAVPFTLPPAGMGNNAKASDFMNRQDARSGDGEGYDTTLIPAPIVGGGLIYTMDAAGNISAHDAANIEQVRWTSDAMTHRHQPLLYGGGLAYADGKLFVVGNTRAAALDAATGKTLWISQTTDSFRSAPLAAGGLVIATTIGSQTLAFDAATGEVRWQHVGMSETTRMMNGVTPALAGDSVLVPYASGELYELSLADGRERWSQSSIATLRTRADSTAQGAGGDPVVDGQAVFATTIGSSLTALSTAQGQRIWERPIISFNTPLLVGDYVFVMGYDGTLVCMVKYDGRIRWSTALPVYKDEEKKRHLITWRGPVMAGEKLYVVGSQGEMRIFNAADGTLIETRDIPENIYTTPVLADGRMYLVSQDATLYMLQ